MVIRLNEVPCDVGLSNLKIVNGNIIKTERETYVKTFGCFSNMVVENVINSVYFFDFNFLKKEHLEYDGEQVEKIIELKKEDYGKFKSYDVLKGYLDHKYDN